MANGCWLLAVEPRMGRHEVAMGVNPWFLVPSRTQSPEWGGTGTHVGCFTVSPLAKSASSDSYHPVGVPE